MTERKMLMELVKKITDNRGDLSQTDFVSFLIDSQLKDEAKSKVAVSREEFDDLRQDVKKLLDKVGGPKDSKFVTKIEMASFQQDTKRLLKNFVDFFIGYGLEIGKDSSITDLEELTSQLGDIDKKSESSEEGREVKIKWK
jgi:Rps23 Pro-64 3,4-dihydroxylase Tpa1-like proline 4-hydroxylase